MKCVVNRIRRPATMIDSRQFVIASVKNQRSNLVETGCKLVAHSSKRWEHGICKMQRSTSDLSYMYMYINYNEFGC